MINNVISRPSQRACVFVVLRFPLDLLRFAEFSKIETVIIRLYFLFLSFFFFSRELMNYLISLYARICMWRRLLLKTSKQVSHISTAWKVKPKKKLLGHLKMLKSSRFWCRRLVNFFFIAIHSEKVEVHLRGFALRVFHISLNDIDKWPSFYFKNKMRRNSIKA